MDQLRSPASVRRRYVEALSTQFEFFAPWLLDYGYRPRLAYWGGGTPSMLDASDIATLGGEMCAAFNLEPGSLEEFTVESSPETLTPEKLAALRAVGVSRLSIGVQSFVEEELRRAGRSHSSKQAVAAFRAACACGFHSINLDLIAGFPGQTKAMIQETVSVCSELEPEHVTLYVYDDRAPTVMSEQIKRGYRPAISENDRLELYRIGRERLLEAGYNEYMPLYFAKYDGARFKGELYYFSMGGDYFGFGSGAHSSIAQHFAGNRAGRLGHFMEDPCDFDSVVRYTRNPLFITPLPPTSPGVNFDLFRRRFGYEFGEIRDAGEIRSWLAGMSRRGAAISETETELEIRWSNGLTVPTLEESIPGR